MATIGFGDDLNQFCDRLGIPKTAKRVVIEMGVGIAATVYVECLLSKEQAVAMADSPAIEPIIVPVESVRVGERGTVEVTGRGEAYKRRET